MNGSKFYRLLVGVVILLLAACQFPPIPLTPTPTPQAIGCADFSGFPDNTTFGNPFWLPNPTGYKFTGLGAPPFVNVSGNVVGLQFADGLEVDLPGSASSVNLDVASFSQLVGLTALDSSGVAVANANVPSDNIVHNIILAGQGIVKVILKGGGKEGILVKICS